MRSIRIAAEDNVGVALHPLKKGEAQLGVALLEDIPRGHKFALADIPAGGAPVKYGYPIGTATQHIAAGAWVHTHNVATALRESGAYSYAPKIKPLTPLAPPTFMGFERPDGRAAVRNEVWILPMVGCVNDVAARLAADFAHLTVGTTVEGIHAFPHPYGCSQMDQDHAATRRLLAALAGHPNAGAVLALGLGCEDLTREQFFEELGPQPEGRVAYLACQTVADEVAEGGRLLEGLVAYAGGFARRPLGADRLVVGLKCGGSDGLSGITANPAVGAFCDKLVAMGGSALLTEVPEMFGAEQMLMDRAESPAVFEDIVAMINNFKAYFVAHGQVVYDNPSPGNKEGGITTLEDKSLGCVQKGGGAPVVDVIEYGCPVRKKGLTLLDAPGNDLVSTTALAASGAHLVLFTTGRGTPFGVPVPTVKIATNTPLAKRKAGWIDFDAGPVAEGEGIAEAGERLLRLVLAVAGGEVRTRAEQRGFRGIAIFKNGVTV